MLVLGGLGLGVPGAMLLSLGGSASSTLDTAARASIASGVTYAVAAGNENTDACTVSPARTARLRKFYTEWLAALEAVDATAVSPAAREELVALRAKVEGQLKE